MSDRRGQFRLGVVLDAALEGWTSMDYIGEMLLQSLVREHADEVIVSALQPRVSGFWGRFPGPVRSSRKNIDRLLARCIVYPAAIGLQRSRFDVFHIADHSYAHAAHFLPRARTGIFCHDLDALRPILVKADWGPLRRLIASSVFRALKRAALVFYSTQHTRAEISALGIIDDQRLIYAPYGVAPEFSPLAPVDPAVEARLPRGRFLLHVGSGIPRKRLELLFRAFRIVRAAEPEVFLLQLGASLNSLQVSLLETLQIRNAVLSLPKLSRAALAYLYRRAEVVVLTSEREGFGLPVLEALACGAQVLASDIPALREVGGDAVHYCSNAEPSEWATAIRALLPLKVAAPEVQKRLAQAAQFSWSRHASTILSAYRTLL